MAVTLAARGAIARGVAVAGERAIAVLLMPTVPARAMTAESVLAELAGTMGGTAHGEVRLATLWRIVGQPRQCRPDQRPVHRSVHVITAHRRGGRSFDGLHSDRFRFRLDHENGIVRRIRRRVEPCGDHFAGHAGEHLLVQRSGDVLLAALRRHLGLLVLVFAVAGGASGLAHLVTDHGDDGVIRDSALAWTVVVDYVAETRLALLHQAPRKDSLSH
jgi:hypothetical protein